MGMDVFQSNVVIGDGWKLEGAIIDFGSEMNKNLLATGLTLNYQRSTQQINPINSEARYVIASDPQGTLKIDAVIGPSADIAGFIETFGDICNVGKEKDNQISVTPTGTQSCGDTFKQGKAWKCSGCLITGLSMNIQKTAGGNMVIAGITLSFLKLEIGSGDAAGKGKGKTTGKK
jgi:hypothetical protein